MSVLAGPSLVLSFLLLLLLGMDVKEGDREGDRQGDREGGREGDVHAESACEYD